MIRCATRGPIPSSICRTRNQLTWSAGLFDEPQQGEEVLDVRRFQVADAAVLDVGDAAAVELELEQRRVVAGAHQHRLLAQRHATFVLGEHALGDLARLLGLVAAEHELAVVRPRRARSAAAWGALAPPAPRPRSPRRGSAASSGSSAPA